MSAVALLSVIFAAKKAPVAVQLGSFCDMYTIFLSSLSDIRTETSLFFA